MRSQLDYGLPVINLNKKEIKQLEDLQHHAIGTPLKLHHSIDKQIILAITNTPSIKHRIDTLKINFHYKLKQPKTNSVAHRIYKELWNKNIIIMNDTYRLPTLVETDQIIRKYKLQKTMEDECNFTKQQMEKVIKTTMRLQHNEELAQRINTRCSRKMMSYQVPFTPYKHTGGAIQQLLQTNTYINIKTEKTFVPNRQIDLQHELYLTLQQCDHNPE